MIRDFTRSMSAEERQLLEERAEWRSPVTLGNTIKWGAIWLLGLVACVALIAGALQLGEQLGPLLAALPGLAALICFLLLIIVLSNYPRWARHERDWKRNRWPKLRAALADGRVSIRRIQSGAVIEIVPYEDEGNGYIFDIGDYKLLYIHGQWTYPVDDTMPWPNTDFEMVRTSRDGEWIGIFCYGEKLEPRRTIESDEMRFPLMWEHHDEVIEGELDSFADSLLDTERRSAKHPLD